jgi:hypothetical protein
MKRALFFLSFIALLFISFPVQSQAGPESLQSSVSSSDNLIYVKYQIGEKTYVFVYLSDAITLVNIYEEED